MISLEDRLSKTTLELPKARYLTGENGSSGQVAAIAKDRIRMTHHPLSHHEGRFTTRHSTTST